MLLLGLVCLTACGNPPTTFTGDLVPLSGSCDPATHAVLLKRGSFVQFAPREGVLVLEGAITPDRRIDAVLRIAGADHVTAQQTMHAVLADDRVSGDYTTPRCRYRVSLRRVD